MTKLQNKHGVVAVIGLMLALSSCGLSPMGSNTPTQSETTTTPSDTVQVLSLTTLSGTLGRAIPQSEGFRTIAVYDAKSFKQAVSLGSSSMIYADAASLDTKNADKMAVLALARDQGIPVVLEGNAGGALKQVTEGIFHFSGEQQGYLIRPLPNTDGGFSVVSLDRSSTEDASAANMQTLSQKPLGNSATPAWLRQTLAPAALSSQDVLPENPNNKLLTSQGIAPTFWVTQFVYGNTGFGLFNKNYSIGACSAQNPCTNYSQSHPFKNFSAPIFQNAKWYGNWTICGGNAVDLNNKCNASYINSKISTVGSSDTLGFSVGTEVSGTVSGGSLTGLFVNLDASVKVSGEVRYDHSWERSKTSIFTTIDGISITQGYRARFGQGDYKLNYVSGLDGRYERNSNMYFTPTGSAPGCTKARVSDGVNFACALTYDPTDIKLYAGNLVTLGARVWAICKNVDVACLRDWDSIDVQDLPL